MIRRLLPVFLCLASFPSAAGANLESTLRDYYARQAAGQPVRCVQLHGLRVTRTVSEGDSVSVDVETVATIWTAMPGSRPVTETQFATVTMGRVEEEWRVIATQRREEVLAQRLAAANSDAQRSAIVEDAPELQTPALVDALCRRAVTRINQRDFEAAQSLIGLADRIARDCRDDAARSFVLGARSIFVRRQGEQLLSIELAAQSLAAAEESGNSDAIARALLRVGRSQNTELVGTQPYQRIMTLSDWIEDRSIVAYAAGDLAQYYDNQTDHRAALRFALRAAKEASASGDRTSLLNAVMNLGGVYTYQDDPELAAFHFERALALSRELGFKATTASILGVLAEQYALTDDPVRRATANAFVAEGLDMIGCEDAATAAGLLWCRARLAIKEDRYNDAEIDLREAVRRALSAPEGNTAQVLNRLAHLCLLQHRPAEALRVLEQAKVLGDASDRYQIHIQAALALRALHRNEEAKDELEAACRLADDGRSKISSDSRQLQQFFGSRLSAFRELVDLLVERGQTGEALAVAERMKGRALRDILASGGKDIEEAMTKAEQRERLALEQAIVQFNRAMTSTTANAGQRPDVRAELGRARTALDEFNARIAALHGDAAQPTNDHDPVRLPPSLDGVTVLDFVIADQETTVFALYRTADGSTRLQATKIAIPQRALQTVVADFARRVAQRDLDYGVAARKLYDLLIRPVEGAVLRNPTLCIVPDSILWKLPFAALLRPNGEHLVERVAIFYAPSIALLTAPRPHRSLSRDHRGADLIAFANPAIDSARRKSFDDVYRSVTLDPLPDAEKEVRALERLYGPERSRLYIGSAARESTLKEEGVHGRVLHIASHGVLDEVAPMFSALVLVADPHDAREDGLLEAREVLRLPMQADLTILSACDTASGRLTPGEGIVGMTWAFLAAGCPTSVSSQWKAESSAAFRLMVELHERLVRGVPTAAALRGAQLALQRDRRSSHPFYWAPFVVVGAGHDVALDPKDRRKRLGAQPIQKPTE